MKFLRECDIENTEKALRAAIENKKIQMQAKKAQAPAAPVIPNVLSEIFQKVGGSSGQIHHLLENGGEFFQDFIKNAQHSIQEKPWEMLRKVAMYSFATGFAISLRRHGRASSGGKE